MINDSSRLLFLDFDGVLHPDAVYLEKHRPVLKCPGELFMWVPLLIKALDPYPDIKIVLSTSWARVKSFGKARRYLPDELQPRLIGATFHTHMKNDNGYMGWSTGSVTWWDQATRYQQIIRYLSNTGKYPKWIAIDDDVDGWNSRDSYNLVQTDPDTGISDNKVLRNLEQKLANMYTGNN